MKFKKNEDQSVDTLPFLRNGNKTPMEGVTETKFGAGWVGGEMAQRLRALIDLPKVLSSIPSNHMVAHNHL